MIPLASFATFGAALALGVAIVMNVVHKNRALVLYYMIDSLLVAGVLIVMGINENAFGLIVTGLLTFVIKAVMAPSYLIRMIDRANSRFSAATYLSAPLTLLVLSILLVVFRATIMPHLSNVSNPALASLLFAGIFVSFFLIVNRRGALTQIVGILTLENSIILASVFLGVTHSVALELAMAFDMAVWIVIAYTFLRFLYAHFHDIENISLTHLREE